MSDNNDRFTTDAATLLRSRSSAPGAPHKAIQDWAIRQLARDDFEVFYKAEFPALVRFVSRLGTDSHTAVDAVQAAFLDAFRHWKRIDNPRAWLRTAASRIYMKMCFSPETPMEIPASALIQYDDVAEMSERERQVQDALAQLPERQRQVMAWHLDGYRHREIAEYLNISEAAVRQNFRRARQALKQQLGLSEEGENR
ncbi:MAG: sig53 [Actinomycetia bacterium]|nr:sig53 [Actinomycetes bacterium]